MSTGNTGSCILSILWKPYRVRRRKRTPERTPGRTAGGADADGKRSRSTERNLATGNNRIYGFGMAMPSLFVSVVPTFFIHGKLFFIMKNAPRGSQSLSRRSEGTASVWKMSPVWPPQAENPGPLPAFCAVQAVRQHPAAGFGHLLETSFFSIQFIRKSRKKRDTLWAVTDRNG